MATKPTLQTQFVNKPASVGKQSARQRAHTDNKLTRCMARRLREVTTSKLASPVLFTQVAKEQTIQRSVPTHTKKKVR